LASRLLHNGSSYVFAALLAYLAACGSSSETPAAGGDAGSSHDGGVPHPSHDGGTPPNGDATITHDTGAAHDSGPHVSPSCTVVTATSGSIVDASGNVWTLVKTADAGLSVDENGSPAGFSVEVTGVAYVNGVVYQENVNSDWWSWTGTTWQTTKDPTTACATQDAGAEGGTAPTDAGTAIFYGVNAHPQWDSPSIMPQLVQYMTEAGIQSVRIDVSWCNIESANGVWDGGNIPAFDAFIAAAAAAHLEVLGILLDTPTWAAGGDVSEGPCVDSHYPPMDLGATAVNGGPGSPLYNAYVAWVLDRWGVKGTSASGTKWIKYWSVWNEPNGSWAWLEPPGTTSAYGAGNPDPLKYTYLLKGAYTKIHEIDATHTYQVLAPSISGAECYDPGPSGSYEWLPFVYSQGIKDYFDIFEAHYYGNSGIVQNGVADSYATDLSTILELHQQVTLPTMQANGDGSKRVWITETGLPGWADGGIGGPGDVQSAALQAQYLTDGFHYARTGMTNVDRMFWYEFISNNTATGPGADQDYFSIVDDTPTPWLLKPAYNAYKAIPK
jgi:hypothetical protein